MTAAPGYFQNIIERTEGNMDKDEAELFKLVEGLKPVDPSVLEAFEREMTEHAIPEIVRAVEKRRMLAAESRHRQLELPADRSSDPAE